MSPYLFRSARFAAALLLAAIAIAGCGNIFRRAMYGPNDNHYWGYDDVQIDRNTYRVRYYGGGLTRETADRYLIYRCAELTVTQGYDYFIVVDQSADEETTSEVKNTTSTETTGTGKDQKTNVSNTNTVNTTTRYNPVKTIKLFRGRKPEDNFKAYDAREVISTLGPKIEFRDSTKS